MSKSFTSSSSLGLQSPDLTAIAAMLSEAAQALRKFSDTKPPLRKEDADSTATGATRCYYLSPATLRHEREVLQRYRADDFAGCLWKRIPIWLVWLKS